MVFLGVLIPMVVSVCVQTSIDVISIPSAACKAVGAPVSALRATPRQGTNWEYREFQEYWFLSVCRISRSLRGLVCRLFPRPKPSLPSIHSCHAPPCGVQSAVLYTLCGLQGCGGARLRPAGYAAARHRLGILGISGILVF